MFIAAEWIVAIGSLSIGYGLALYLVKLAADGSLLNTKSMGFVAKVGL